MSLYRIQYRKFLHKYSEGHSAFSALVVGKGIRPVKTERWGASMVISLEWGADSHMVQLMPLLLTISCFSKIQIGFTFLVLAHPGSPGQSAIKWVRVCVYSEGGTVKIWRCPREWRLLIICVGGEISQYSTCWGGHIKNTQFHQFIILMSRFTVVKLEHQCGWFSMLLMLSSDVLQIASCYQRLLVSSTRIYSPVDSQRY